MVDALVTHQRPYFELQDGRRQSKEAVEGDERVRQLRGGPMGLRWHPLLKTPDVNSGHRVLNLVRYKGHHYSLPTLVPIVSRQFENYSSRQAFFYQLFTDGHASIPRLEGNDGYIGVGKSEEKPIVILTSNNQHVVHPPLRSRCVYTKVSLPTDIEETRILHSRVSSASPGLLTQVVKVVRYIRIMMPTVRDKPGLRESIVLLRALLTEGIEMLTAEVIDDHLASLPYADDLAI